MTDHPAPVRASIPDVVSGMLNAFVDPAAMAKQAAKKGFWIGPLLLLSVVAIVFSLLTVPIALRVMQMNPPPNLTREQFERAFPMMKTAYYGFSFATPVIIVALLLLSAWLVGVLCSITGVEAKFSGIFSLLSGCSLISMLQIVANYVVLRLKGDDIQSLQELQPPLGLDIFFGGLKGVPYAVLNCFFDLRNLVHRRSGPGPCNPRPDVERKNFRGDHPGLAHSAAAPDARGRFPARLIVGIGGLFMLWLRPLVLGNQRPRRFHHSHPLPRQLPHFLLLIELLHFGRHIVKIPA